MTRCNARSDLPADGAVVLKRRTNNAFTVCVIHRTARVSATLNTLSTG
jgi:hypothetical protein